MKNDDSRERLWRGMVCLSLAIGFEENRARVGLRDAVDRLREGLKYNSLWLEEDEQLLVKVLAEEVSREELAERLCSPERMRLAGKGTH